MSAEQEPFLPLQWGDKTLEMTANNSQLYTFLGRSAIKIGNDEFVIDNSAVNHVYVATAKDKGLYFFQEHDAEEYATMSRFMLENAFPMVLNARCIPTVDMQVWLQEVDKEVENFVLAIPDGVDEKS